MSARPIDLNQPAHRLDYALLQNCDFSAPFAWRLGTAITPSEFLGHVHRVSEQLPGNGHIINLCEDRYAFMVGFAAALTAHRTTLLPPTRASQVVDELAQAHPGACCLHDQDIQSILESCDDAGDHCHRDRCIPLVDPDHLAAIVFTSGSTGRARPNLKHWSDLVTGARMLRQRFGFGLDGSCSLVATVPPQHMYGLETSILTPLLNGVGLYTGPTFFPADICTALQSIPDFRVLVTTPFHLRTCLESDLQWPPLQTIISATAPLSKTLAERAEQRFGCTVMEIYGCTETGAVASRTPLISDAWQLFDGVHLQERDDRHELHGSHLRECVPLHDLLESLDQHRFLLRGRHADMVNIAGKRASLGDLNKRLLDIEGIDDGVFFIPDDEPSGVTRLAAFVVSKTLDARSISRQLTARVDPIFIPRPLHLVDRLPRNETGKLTRDALLAMHQTLKRE